ncbi:MAG: LysR family transcriptional regulator [Coriobacteriales bacterium]|nr:LysR family transcriptional regulator [Coriobacteriales bacterium]
MDSESTDNNIRIELLHEFSVFVWHMNITKAAKELNITQSTLSKHISILEKELGVQLIERGSRMTLTSAGQFFAEFVCSMIPEYQYAVRHTRKLHKNEPDMTLRIVRSSMPTEIFLLLQDLAIEFFANCRYRKYKFVNQGTDSIENMLVADRADLAIKAGFRPIEDEVARAAQEGITLIHFLDDQLFLWAKADNKLLKDKGLLSMADLEGLRIMTMVDNKGLRGQYEGNKYLLSQYNLTLHPDVRIADEYNDLLLLDPGDSVFLIPKSLRSLQNIARNTSMVVYDFQQGVAIDHNYLAYKTDNPSPALSFFIKFLESHRAKMPQ